MSEASRGEKSVNGKGKAGGDGDANILPAEAFTHGGVRKTKFEPKVPTRRSKKLSAVKKEQGNGDDGELPDELQRLIKQSQDDAAGFRRRQDSKAPVRVAFGFGSTTTGRATTGSHGFASARAGSGGRGGWGGGGGGSGGGGRVASNRRNSNFVIEDDEAYVGPKSAKKKGGQEPLDYTKYYPVTLPLRRPMPGIAEFLDEEEFGGHEYDEDAIPAAQELGLFEESAEDKFIFFQLPNALPVDLLPGTDGDNGSSEPCKPPGGLIGLDMLAEGFLGKLLIYESGAVKLRLGDIILDAMPGTNCVFAQELAAVNPVAKHCLFLGDINQRAVLTPDIERLLSKSVDVR